MGGISTCTYTVAEAGDDDCVICEDALEAVPHCRDDAAREQACKAQYKAHAAAALRSIHTKSSATPVNGS